MSRHSPPPELEIDLNGESQRFRSDSHDERESTYWTLHGVLVKSPLAERRQIMRHLHAWSGIDKGNPLRRSMTEEEIAQLVAKGHTVGAHSVHHLALGHQPSEVQQQEVMECRTELSRRHGSVEAFAYPYGDYNDETVRLVRAAGFKMALTCDERPVEPRPDPFRLPRVEVKPFSFTEFTRWLEAWGASPRASRFAPITAGS